MQDVEVFPAIRIASGRIGEVAFAEWVKKTLLTDGDRAHLRTVGILTEKICNLWDRRIFRDYITVSGSEKWGPEQLALDRATGREPPGQLAVNPTLPRIPEGLLIGAIAEVCERTPSPVGLDVLEPGIRSRTIQILGDPLLQRLDATIVVDLWVHVSGARGGARLSLPGGWRLAARLNLLEDRLGLEEALDTQEGHRPVLPFLPFQVRTVLLSHEE